MLRTKRSSRSSMLHHGLEDVASLGSTMELRSLIRLAGMLALFLMLFSPVLARAQFLDPSLVSFAPGPPVADRPFEMVMLVIPCLTGYLSSEGAMVSVADEVIEVTARWSPLYLCPPTQIYEIEIPIPPLAAGQYEVRLVGQDMDDPKLPRLLIATSVEVVPQNLAINRPIQIPASSPAWLALLVAALFLLGVSRKPKAA